MNKVKRRIKRSIFAVGHLFLLLCGSFCAFFLKRFNDGYKNVWLISERGIDARDNGYIFYKYLKEKHPEINSYYVIDKKSPDYEKVKNFGNIIDYRSFQHYIMLSLSKYNVSTHIMGYTPDVVIFVWLDKLHVIRGRKIYLQHGIIKDNMVMNHYPYVKLDLFNTTAKPEYEYIRDNYGHPLGTVQMLGLCRYDNLYDTKKLEKKQILLMPTWRHNIAAAKPSLEEFKATDYYRAFQNFLNNSRLSNLLKEYGYELVFYPHLQMQKYMKAYTISSSNIRFADASNADVQDLLIESKLLITDYSSVFFDFSYMKKPVIYYQFDEEEFRKNQYQEGYFIYRRDGFGPVVQKEEELIDHIEMALKNDCMISAECERKIDNFFTLRDRHNCDRMFAAIMNLN